MKKEESNTGSNEMIVGGRKKRGRKSKELFHVVHSCPKSRRRRKCMLKHTMYFKTYKILSSPYVKFIKFLRNVL